MKFLSHPYFSLFCTMVNCWFMVLNIMWGSWFWAALSGACAYICYTGYKNGSTK